MQRRPVYSHIDAGWKSSSEMFLSWREGWEGQKGYTSWLRKCLFGWLMEQQKRLAQRQWRASPSQLEEQPTITAITEHNSLLKEYRQNGTWFPERRGRKYSWSCQGFTDLNGSATEIKVSLNSGEVLLLRDEFKNTSSETLINTFPTVSSSELKRNSILQSTLAKSINIHHKIHICSFL